LEERLYPLGWDLKDRWELGKRRGGEGGEESSRPRKTAGAKPEVQVVKVYMCVAVAGNELQSTMEAHLFWDGIRGQRTAPFIPAGRREGSG
jgi:hypothetical protein